MIAYHDTEWGAPAHDDRLLFEFLVLEGAQAGLSWETILRKRAAYRRAFEGFDPMAVARFGEPHVRRLLGDAGIVRNEAKIRSAIANARAFIKVQAEFGTFDAYLGRFAAPSRRTAARTISEVPSRTAESDALSRDLKRRGFSFVGTTICYAFMQAVGLVNDHTRDCFRYRELARIARPAPSTDSRAGIP